MKVQWKVFTALSVVLILFASIYASYRVLRRADVSKPSIHQAPGSRLFMSMEGFRFTQSENGRVAWRMHARNADLYENKEAVLKDLEINFISPDHKEATLIGETGKMDTATGDAAIRGIDREVRIVTSEGYLMTTNSLFWKAGQRLVNTPDSFKLLGTEIYLEGKGLSGNVDMRTVTVDNNVKAVLQE